MSWVPPPLPPLPPSPRPARSCATTAKRLLCQCEYYQRYRRCRGTQRHFTNVAARCHQSRQGRPLSATSAAGPRGHQCLPLVLRPLLRRAATIAYTPPAPPATAAPPLSRSCYRLYQYLPGPTARAAVQHYSQAAHMAACCRQWMLPWLPPGPCTPAQCRRLTASCFRLYFSSIACTDFLISIFVNCMCLLVLTYLLPFRLPSHSCMEAQVLLLRVSVTTTTEAILIVFLLIRSLLIYMRTVI